MIPRAEQFETQPLPAEPELLVPERGVRVEAAAPRHAVPVAELYAAAYARGDFFAGRYEDRDRQIFDPDWLSDDFQNPDHLWYVFTDERGDVIGSTGYFHDTDVDGRSVFTSDETQITPAGRGLRIMDRFFKRTVPSLEATGAQLTTEFLLSPESKGLRRTLQTDLGMTATGILPHVLKHPELSITRSEITATKFRDIEPRPARLVPEFALLHRIVRSQLPELEPPNVHWQAPRVPAPVFAERYEEAGEPVPADNPAAQQAALEAGFRPVVFDPQRHEFTVARYPAERPDLGFIMKQESVVANSWLVAYLDNLYTGSVQRPQSDEQLKDGAS